jgi:GNAT superfamily N-acetyltransferase
MLIDTLENVPEFIPTVAQWIYQEFPHEFLGLTLQDWTQQFADSQGDSCMTFVALENGQVLGTASLDQSDLPPRPDFSPWLASVYVVPEARGLGLGSLLVQKIEYEAAKQVYAKIYLHTFDREDFYLKRGWKTLESLHYWEHELVVMVKDIK